ncbi:MAG: hypothetical protein EHM67_19070 [Hyphomicrobiaceae bacterium]|nr:MAG: hypothetical protein EHM67_19070 [Hyphomicrobiaceae bacterium]
MAEIFQAGCAYQDGIGADQYLATRDRTHGGNDERQAPYEQVDKGSVDLVFCRKQILSSR